MHHLVLHPIPLALINHAQEGVEHGLSQRDRNLDFSVRNFCSRKGLVSWVLQRSLDVWYRGCVFGYEAKLKLEKLPRGQGGNPINSPLS